MNSVKANDLLNILNGNAERDRYEKLISLKFGRNFGAHFAYVLGFDCDEEYLVFACQFRVVVGRVHTQLLGSIGLNRLKVMASQIKLVGIN